MSADDLSTPLGRTPKRRRLRLPFTAWQALAAVLGCLLLTFLGFALFADNPFGGEPMVRLALQQPPAAAPQKPAETPGGKPADTPAIAAKPAETAAAPAAAGHHTVTIIDGSSGARREVQVLGEEPAAGGSAAPDATPAGGNARLLEKSRHGLVPMTADGQKPFSAYSETTDALRAKAAKMPIVAIVVGGLGVGAAKTVDAIMKLPGAVTLAFTPYGAEPTKLAERARTLHHEVLLQVPMEPFDYPDNDPGPQTLLTTLEAEQNIDRLMWHMSRIQGYVGIANFMGARFVANDTAMKPVLREAARRGLGYLDDGTSQRSVAGGAADAVAMPFARADLAIDAVPTAIEIDRALAKLESTARDQGLAIGTASALPVAIERIAAWAKQLESRGILLAPLTTAMLKSKSS